MPLPDKTTSTDGFDPDAYLAKKYGDKKVSDEFDPDAYLAKKNIPQVDPDKIGDLEAAKIGIQKGGTLGLAPTISGIGEGAGQALGLLTSSSDIPLKDRLSGAYEAGIEGFKKGRGERIALQKKAEQEAPGAYAAGNISGGLLSVPFVAAGKGIQGAAKVGAALGGVEAIGESESIEDAAGKVAGGGLIGGGIGAIGKGVSAAAQKLVPKLDELANRLGFSSLRGYKKDIKKAFLKDEIEQIGKELYDQKIVNNIPKGVEALADKTEKRIKEIGPKYGALLKDISEKSGPVIDTTEAAINVMNKVDDHVAGMPELLSQENARKSIYKNLENFAKDGKKLTIEAAQKVKQSLKKASNFETTYLNGVPEDVKVARSLYHEMNGMIDDAAEKYASQAGTAKDVVQGLRKQLYNLHVANNMATGRSLGEVANRFLSPTDYISGAGALASDLAEGAADKGLLGLGAALANKAVREYGSSAGGIAAKKTAGLLSKVPSVSPKLGTAAIIGARGLIPSGEQK